MLCALLFALQTKGHDDAVFKSELVTRAEAELILPQYSEWRAFVFDRVSGECWMTGTMGNQIRGPRKPAGTIDVGDLDLMAVGYTRESMVVAARKTPEGFGRESVSVFQVKLYDKLVSEGVWQSKTTFLKKFDVDTAAKKAIEAQETIVGEMRGKLDATTFGVTKVHIESLDQHDGPAAVFLGIEDVTALFRGVLVVPIDGSEPVFFPGSWVSSFAVAYGFILVMASESDPSKMDVVQRVDGEWVHRRTVSLLEGSVLRSAYGNGGALFTVTGDKTGVWEIGFYGGEPKRTEMNAPVEKMAFSQGCVYWLDGTTVKIRDFVAGID